MVRDTTSNRLTAPSPSAKFPPPGPKVTSPALTVNPLRRPSLPMSGTPVVSVARGVLMKPQPSQVIPFGLAMMTSALPPNTSVRPRSELRFCDVTSLRMTDAGPLPCRFGLPGVTPPSFDVPISPLKLLRMTPGVPTLKLLYLLCDRPWLLGPTISMSGTPFGAAPIPGRFAKDPPTSGDMSCA
ncbi:hypothetical protein D3C80_570550 [compost metagenome]